jgi:hypothetical protein
LATSITEAEVADAILRTDPNKAPDPDGLTGWFYRIHSRVLAPFLIRLFNFVLDGALIPEQLKQGIVTTIYKGKDDPLNIANRRPITLLNADYKLLSKVINTRLIKLLPKLIAANQTGFIFGRSILDNIISLHSVFDLITPSPQFSLPLITFLDFEKAFDSIFHSADISTLKHLNFLSKLVNLITNMLTGASATISVNGHLSKPFSFKRGTRQGDPISPTLFVLALECFNRALLNDRTLRGLLFSPIHRIKTLLFADDIVLLTGTREELSRALDLVNTFCQASAMTVSSKKSRCLCVHYNSSVPELPFQQATTERPEKYLGHLFSPKGKVPQLPLLTKEISSTLQKLKYNHFTEMSKVAILQSYIFPKLVHSLYCELPDSSFYSSFNKLVQSFLWSSNTATNTRPRITLDRLQQPISEGGLGLWNVELKHSNARSTVRKGSPLSPQHLTPLYVEVWRAQIANACVLSKDQIIDYRFTHKLIFRSNRLTASFNCWKLIQSRSKQQGNTLIPPTEPIKTKPIYLPSNPTPPLRLTPSQIRWREQFDISWPHIWRCIHSIRHAPTFKVLCGDSTQEFSPFTEATIRKHFARSAQHLNPHSTFSSSVLRHYS